MARKITLTLPDWADDKEINIFAGVEILARKFPGEDVFHVKRVRCNMCGLCCMNLKGDLHPFPVVGGRCIYLKQWGKVGDKFLCDLGFFRPMACSATDPTLMEECIIELEAVPIEG
jgi:hypothetical protein